jgi:TonB family protein
MSRVVLIPVVCTAVAVAQSLVPPVAMVQCHQPEYTEEARLGHLSGVVTLALTVNDDGTTSDIHVVTPVGLGLDESAVSCMRQSRYSPAQQGGKPVPFKIDVPLSFTGHWDSDWHLSAAAFTTANGAVRPILLKARFPGATGDRRSASVCLHLTVAKDGSPRDIAVASPRDARLEKDAVAIVADWRFRPGTRNHQPVDIPATLTLVHGAGGR